MWEKIQKVYILDSHLEIILKHTNKYIDKTRIVLHVKYFPIIFKIQIPIYDNRIVINWQFQLKYLHLTL